MWISMCGIRKNDPSVRERELASFLKIRDNYEKVVLAGECDKPVT